MLTRKYYKMIAQVINDNTYGNRLITSNFINDICIEFKKDNTLFNRDKFVKACNDRCDCGCEDSI